MTDSRLQSESPSNSAYYGPHADMEWRRTRLVRERRRKSSSRARVATSPLYACTARIDAAIPCAPSQWPTSQVRHRTLHLLLSPTIQFGLQWCTTASDWVSRALLLPRLAPFLEPCISQFSGEFGPATSFSI